MEIAELKFDDLPRVISQLCEEVKLLKEILLNKPSNLHPAEREWFNLLELCGYLPDQPSPDTVYRWLREEKIPVCRGAKKLTFIKKDIDNWIRQGRPKPIPQIQIETDNFLSTKTRRLKKVKHFPK